MNIFSRGAATDEHKFRSEKEKRWVVSDSLPPHLVIIMAINILAASLLIPFILRGYQYLSLGTSAIVCLLSVLTAFYSHEKKIKAMTFLACMAMLFVFFSSPVVPALIPGTVTSVGACAALICSAKKRLNLIAPILMAASFILSIVLCQDLLIASVALIPFLAAFAIGLASRRKAALTASVATGAAVIFAALLAIAAVLIYFNYNAIDPEAIATASRAVAANLTRLFEQALSEYGQIEITHDIHKVIVHTVNTYINLSPGIVIAAATVVSYFAVKSEHNLLSANGVIRFVDESTSVVTLNVFASAVFFLALVLSFAQDPFGETSMVATVALNLCIILSPALILTAFEAIRWLPTKLGIIGLILAGALIVFVLISLSSFPLIIPLIGAAFIIIRSVDDWAKEHYKKGENK